MIFKNKKESINDGLSEVKNSKAHYIAIAVISLFLMATTDGLFPLPASGYVDVWSMCNWGLTYETGFILRGFVGTILMLFTDAISFKLVYIITAVLFVIIACQFIYINISIYKRSKRVGSVLLIFFIMAQPSNARWLLTGSMYSRLDFFVIIFALFIFIGVLKAKKDKVYYWIVPLSLLAILIHEIFAVAFASLIFALLMLKTSLREDKINLKPLYFYYLPVLVIFGLVIAFGGTDLTCAKFTAIMEQNLAEDLREGMVSVARDVVSDGLSMKMERVRYLFTEDVRNLMVLTYIVLSPTIALFIGLFVKLFKMSDKKHEKIMMVLIAGSCFAPLTSSVYGCDHFRWIGYFIFCFSAAMVFLYFLNDKYKEIILNYIEKYALYFIIASIMAMTFGALRNMQTMPLLERLYYNRLQKLGSFFN